MITRPRRSWAGKGNRRKFQMMDYEGIALNRKRQARTNEIVWECNILLTIKITILKIVMSPLTMPKTITSCKDRITVLLLANVGIGELGCIKGLTKATVLVSQVFFLINETMTGQEESVSHKAIFVWKKTATWGLRLVVCNNKTGTSAERAVALGFCSQACQSLVKSSWELHVIALWLNNSKTGQELAREDNLSKPKKQAG